MLLVWESPISTTFAQCAFKKCCSWWSHAFVYSHCSAICVTHDIIINTFFPPVIQSTCAEDWCIHPALSVAHGSAVGRDPAAKDVSAAIPISRPDAAFVTALPLPIQNTHVIITVHLRETDACYWFFFLTIKPVKLLIFIYWILVTILWREREWKHVELCCLSP